MTQKTLDEAVLEHNMLQEEIKKLVHERNSLPRNDKENASRLFGEISSLQAAVKRLKPQIKVLRAEEQAKQRVERALERSKDSHAMWVMAVRELFGMEGLAQCYEFMNNERKFRELTTG